MVNVPAIVMGQKSFRRRSAKEAQARVNGILVAVYGTLKRGFHNNRLLEEYGAEFMGPVKTVQPYKLVVDGLPYLLPQPGVGFQVKCELFRVNQECLARLDQLESHPNFYRRQEVNVTNSVEMFSAWVYFLAPTGRFATINDLPAVEEFTGHR